MVLLQFLTTPTYAATAICPLECLGHDAGSQGIPRVLGGPPTTVLSKRSIRLRCPEDRSFRRLRSHCPAARCSHVDL